MQMDGFLPYQGIESIESALNAVHYEYTRDYGCHLHT